MPDKALAVALRCGNCGNNLPAGAAFCPECGASVDRSLSTAPMLPGFEIVRPLGAGGAAQVYLARQQSLDRIVAVKVLRQGVEEDDATWRDFRKEAKTVARLSGHPNVVTVYTAGRAETGQPYLVTEYMDRGSLEEAIATTGPIDPRTVATLGVGIAEALIAAHAVGIHHRDVKPANVLQSHDGRVKLADFGIARLLSGQSVTTTDVFAFTPEHVAPEMLRREPDGPWSDVYGLASTLATALLGHPPLRRSSDESMDAFLTRKLMAPPPDLSGVPAELAGPVRRALDPDPVRRPTMEEFRDQLAAAAQQLAGAVPPTVLAAEPEPTRPVTPPITVVIDSPVGRPRRRTGVAAAVVLAGLVAVIAAVLLSDRGDDDRSVAGPDFTTATTAASATSPPGTTEGTARTTSPASTNPATLAPAPSTEAAATTLVTTTVVTTAVPTTDQPSTTVASPAPSPTPSGGALSDSEAEAFIEGYYADVAAGDYERSWSQLAPEFQSGKAVSYEYYTGFWDDNDVDVEDVDLLHANSHEATMLVELRWNGSDSTTTDEFTLRRDEAGRWLIAAQTSADR
jgi:serine/threonine protein kinase